ncbi:MAG: hypothetical protein M3Y87_03135 [Myxococcota bacterium]|nr:hypothetical protein [Myxococcota bacterium]
MTKKQRTPQAVPMARVLSAQQLRKLLREGRLVRQDLEERIARMRRIDPNDAAARAR